MDQDIRKSALQDPIVLKVGLLLFHAPQDIMARVQDFMEVHVVDHAPQDPYVILASQRLLFALKKLPKPSIPKYI